MLGFDNGGLGLLSCPAVVGPLAGPMLQILLTVLPGVLLTMLGGIIALFKPSGMKNLVKLLWRQKLAVVLLGLLIGGGVYGYGALGSGTRSGAAGEAQQGKDWTTARFDLRRQGIVPSTPSPTVPKLIWAFK